MKKIETENCPCCPNHCPKDSLQCKKGQSYFSGDRSNTDFSHTHGRHDFGHHEHHRHFDKEKFPSHFQPDSLSGQLMEAAHTIMRSAHEPGFSEEIFFKALTVSEKNELLSLLKKINKK